MPQPNRQMVGLGRTVAVAVFLLVLLPGGEAVVYSNLWGKNGEKWNPAGPLPDFSYAGYKQGNEPVPTPPVTKSVTEFRRAGMSDTDMLQAALSWAHKQPVTNGFTVLFIPRGTYLLTQRLWIKRPRLVLRGAGRGKTVFSIPKSLTGIYGPNPEDERGAYVNTDAFVTIKGTAVVGSLLATVNKFAAKGSQWVQVDRPSAIKVGEYYDIWFRDVAGKFNDYMFNNLWKAPDRYLNSQRVKFHTKVVAKNGNMVKLERYLPYEVRSGLNTVSFRTRPHTVYESGVEGVTFKFAWSNYAGHHLEPGWNSVEVSAARDCWVRDIESVNGDSTVLINGATSIHVEGVLIRVSRTRANSIPNKYGERANVDGHWGVQHSHSFDCMVKQVDVRCSMLHDVGTGSSGKFSVYMDSRMSDGNLDLHRALSGPTLYTNIDVGLGNDGLSSGGPKASGPNALAGTTWWNIRSKRPLTPNRSDLPAGSCGFGPVINLVALKLDPKQAKRICRTWRYEPQVTAPMNLYKAQYARRMRLAAAAVAANATAVAPV